MASWNLAPEYRALAADFGSLEAVFAIEGERLTKDPLSEVVRIERDGVRYYVKRYWGRVKVCAVIWGVRGSRPNGRTSNCSPSGASLPRLLLRMVLSARQERLCVAR